MRPTEVSRSKNYRSKFNISSLLLAGALSVGSLFTAGEAYALSGTLSAAGTTTTPRDSSGASGGATLIRTAASVPSTESPSSQVTGPSEPSSAPAPTTTTRTSGGSRRRAQEEEGTTRHRTSGGSGISTKRTSHQGGKSVVESKDNKTVAPVSTAPDRVHFSLSGGFESRYIYHGLDIISFNSKLLTYRFTPGTRSGAVDPALDFQKDNSSSAITYENADVAFKGFHLGVGYVRAISATYPFFQQSRDPIIAANFSVPDQDAVPGNHRRFYQEVDVNADYTVSIVANILDATVGYNSYFFAYHDFKGASYQGELFGRLAYKQLKYVVPSFTFYRYVSNYNINSAAGNLNGSYAEFRLDGSVPVYTNNLFSVALAPYAAAGYNISYLKYGDNNVGGWNDLELGIKVPTTLGKHFTVTPYGNYGLDLSSNNQAINNFTGNGYGERTHFWGGVTVAYSF